MKFKTLALLCAVLLSAAGTAGARAQGVEALPSDSVRFDYPLMDYNEPKQYVISDIRVHGITYIDPEVLISAIGLQRGDTVMLPGEYISGAVRRLWIQRRFSDIKTVVETEADSARIHLYLTQRAQVYKWNIEGIRKGETTELLEKLSLRRGVELSDFRINTAIRTIDDYFHEKGFRNVGVDVKVANDTTFQNSVIVTFDVHKGPKVRIGAIEFEGNEAFIDKRLRRTLKKTKQKSINFLASSKFNQAKYDEDKLNLIDFYNSKGYRNATILSDSIYPLTDNRIGIRLTLDEGNKFYYRNISWMGNSVFPTENLNALLGIQPGDTYDRKTMDKQLGIRNEMDPMKISVSSLYQNNGYLMSEIDPQEIIVGTDSIDLQIKVIERKQVTVNTIAITGNNRVYDHVIRREMDVRPGDLYNREMLMSTITRIGQLQHFLPESAQPKFDVEGNDLLNLTFPLEEQASDQIEISGGWGSGMFVGSVGLTLTNFALKNAFKKGAWRPYPYGENQQLSLRAQSNGTYYKSLSLNFTDPWFGGKKPNSLSVGLYYSDQTDAIYAWQVGTKHFRTMGASLGIGRRLKWPDRMFTLYNEVMYQAYNLRDWDAFGLGFTNGTANIVALRTILSRNTVANPYFPADGSEFSFALSLTPPYSLFDGKDYKSTAMSSKERYRWIEYHKWNLKADWYFPLTMNQKLVLRAHAELGFIGSYNSHKRSPFEGFEMGGDGMSGYNLYGVDVVGLRGYENGSLSPTDGQQSQAYNKYSLEVRYPFVRQGQTMIYGLVFAEGGNAFDSLQKFDPLSIKRSVGAGLRLYLPMVGWIGVDYGYGFDHDRTGAKGGGHPHFIIGQNF
jgi:outer membrane protein insertion porin family